MHRLKSILPSFSSFVSASAGTGKTKNLIDRLTNLLLHGAKPHKILCLAFTKSAAAEILSRINQKLAFFCTCSEGELLKELKNLGFNNISPEIITQARTLFAEFIDAIEPLNIQTIHSFCQQLIAKFPFEVGVNINFSLLDNNQIINLIQIAKIHTIKLSKENQNLAAAINYLSWHLKEYSLDELVKEIINNREKLDNFYKNTSNIKFHIEENEEQMVIEFIKSISFESNILNWLSSGGKSDLKKKEIIEKFFSYSKDLQVFSIHEYFSCFLTQTGDLLKNLVTKALQESNVEYYEFLLKEQIRVCKFNKIYNKMKLKNLTNSFLIFSYHLRESYKELKAERGVLDYDDLICLSNDLLSDNSAADWVRYKLDGGIDHILVDEAQDNSPNQWNIINKISEEFFCSTDILKSIFIVGDSKQSIFKFQGADPEIFSQMNKLLPGDILRVNLNISYRSGSKILEFIDNIFNLPHIKPHVGFMEGKISHVVSKNFAGEVEIWPLILESEKIQEQQWSITELLEEQEQAEELLALKIAQEIDKLIKTNKFIYSKNRPITPGDVMVLTRRRTGFIQILIKALRSMNIPTAGIDRLRLLEHPIILDILALSKFILCSEDDFNLAIVLKSPIFNISETELMKLCYKRDNNLWSILKDKQNYINICKFFENLESDSLFLFYFNLIEQKKLRSIYLNEFGFEANDVFDAFLDLVEKFEKDNISSLQLFIEYLNNANVEIQRDFSLNTDLVRIMTVHAAKGLQAPIVILTDTTTLPFNDDNIVWSENGEPFWSAKVKYHSEEIAYAKFKNLAYEYAEYVRLLYVALTRAEEKIIITGISKSEEISDKTWYAICNKV